MWRTDAEGVVKEALTEIVYTILTRIEAAGYYAMLYASKDWLENRLDMDRLGRFDVWLAQWNEEATYRGAVRHLAVYQRGRIPGIPGRVDLDETTGYRDYKEHIGQYYEPEVSGIRAGDTVRVTGRLYRRLRQDRRGKDGKRVYSVDRVLPGKVCPILIGGGLGWVKAEDCSHRAGCCLLPGRRRGEGKGRRGQLCHRGRVWRPGCAPLPSM